MMVKVRDYADQDVGAVARIYGANVLNGTGTFECEPPSPEAMSVRLDRSMRRGLPVLVAEIEGLVVGYAAASPFNLREGYRWTAEVSVHVDDAHQKRGAGSALLAELIERCRKAGVCELIALIGDRENHGSRSLFQNAGFFLIGVGERLGWKFGKPLDVIFMQKPLSSRPDQ